jgi:hypothetical protein
MKPETRPTAHHTSPGEPTAIVPPQALARVLTSPGGSLSMLYGSKPVFHLALRLAAHAMQNGHTIAAIDGCNRFNVHLLARHAREHRIDPDAFLKRIFVSRGFTCYQMEAAITRRLPAFLRTKGARAALILGLLETFYDQQAPFREASLMLERVIAALQEIKSGGVSVLLVCSDVRVLPEERNRFITRLKEGSDAVYHVTVNEEHAPVIRLESTGNTPRPHPSLQPQGE